MKLTQNIENKFFSIYNLNTLIECNKAQSKITFRMRIIEGAHEGYIFKSFKKNTLLLSYKKDPSHIENHKNLNTLIYKVKEKTINS